MAYDTEAVYFTTSESSGHSSSSDGVHVDYTHTLYNHIAPDGTPLTIEQYMTMKRNAGHEVSRLMDWETAYKRMQERDADKYLTGPSKITKEAYWEALECLPPVRWCHHNGVQSFFMSEMLTGNITAVYAEIDGSYYTTNMRTTTTANDVSKVFMDYHRSL